MRLDLTLAKIMRPQNSIGKKEETRKMTITSVKSGLEFMLIDRVKMHGEKIIIIK